MTYTYTPNPRHSPDERDLDYWKHQAAVRQRIIEKQNKTVRDLTASVVSLEDDVARLEADYDVVEAELRACKPR